MAPSYSRTTDSDQARGSPDHDINLASGGCIGHSHQHGQPKVINIASVSSKKHIYPYDP